MPPDSILLKHIRAAKRAHSHEGKRAVFSDLLREVFKIGLEELLPGIEAKLGSKIWGVRGRADLLFSNVVFEFKLNLRDQRELTDALENKLPKYLQALHEAEPERKHIGIATDSIKFRAYLPTIEKDEVIKLEPIGDELNLEKVTSEEAILWLDSFLFSQLQIKPTAEDIKWRFGLESPTYALSIEKLEAMWKTVESFRDAKLMLDLWAKHMEMVYGSKPDPQAFINQTYLVTLIKLILYLKLGEAKTVKKSEIEKVLIGEFFRNYGILNLIEEDFFTWLIRYSRIKEKAIDLACSLAGELLRYDMTQIDEDLFKEIYQEIVSRSERHKIGEYYTPEWLCELVLRESLDEWKREHEGIPRILDPACGSGTFLTNAIRLLIEELKARGVESQEAAEQIFGNVIGIDINPLAVIIARANYILMFRNGYPTFNVTIPVYIADSIKLPSEVRTEIKGVEVYSVEVNEHQLHFPVRIASDRAVFGLVLEGMKRAIETYKERRDKKAAPKVFERWADKVPAEEFEVLSSTLETLLKLVDEDKDSIWTFWLNNIYAPIALKETPFDLVVGNPPWVAMRYFENKDYQDFLKESIFKFKLLDRKEVKLFTHMDTSTLFFRKVSDMYLKESGSLGFVMPKSVLGGAQQHEKFKLFENPSIKLNTIFDLEGVSPLFNVPSCVLVCTKGQKISYPVSTIRYAGTLEKKNERLLEALKVLKTSVYEYKPPTVSAKRSFYHDQVKEGATIVPRALWFVEFEALPTGWVDTRTPAVKTSSRIQMKPPWTSIRMRGNIGSDFIYVTLLGGDIIRFGYKELKPVILPVEPSGERYAMLDVEELVQRGFRGITEWLEKAQRTWIRNAREKAKKSCPRVISWLNYRNKISNQNPQAKFAVLYNKSGTNLASCVVNRQNLPPLKVGEKLIEPKGLIAEDSSYYYETDNHPEAHFLCAVLNSNEINKAIKPFQPRGLFGERSIHRRPFMFPTPQFDKRNPDHARLVELGKLCHAKVASLALANRRTAAARRLATKMIEKELREIDDIVKKIIPQLS